jgi:hypothetical protein
MSPGDRTDPRPFEEAAEARLAGNGAGEDDAPDPFAELVGLLTARFEVLVTSVKTLLAVHTDRAQLVIRRRIQTTAIAALAAVVGATLVVYATIHVVRGTAQGFAALFDEQPWLGSLVAGLLFLFLAGGGLAFALRRWNQKELAKQLQKYAALEREQADRIAASEAHDAT